VIFEEEGPLGLGMCMMHGRGVLNERVVLLGPGNGELCPDTAAVRVPPHPVHVIGTARHWNSNGATPHTHTHNNSEAPTARPASGRGMRLLRFEG
jgi:hypothetical protein